jgi:hypothetical protein
MYLAQLVLTKIRSNFPGSDDRVHEARNPYILLSFSFSLTVFQKHTI